MVEKTFWEFWIGRYKNQHTGTVAICCEEIPYSKAMKKGRTQDEAMLKLIAEKRIPENLSLREKLELVKREAEKN